MKNVGVYIAAIAGFGIYGAMTGVDRDESGAIVDGGSLDAFDMRVGDCFDDPSEYDDEVFSLPGVPCSEPHDNEVYAVFDVSMSSYPGEDEIGYVAQERCLEYFEGFVGLDYDSSTLDIFPFYPTSESWGQGDREVVCAIFDMNTQKLVGSVKGSGI
ncbi:MAG: septum formation family protein [Pseudomonadota bacterium]